MTENIEIEEHPINGLFYINDININTSDIISKLDKLKWEPITSHSNSRLVQHYGYKYNYKTYNIYEKCEDIPEFLYELKSYLTDVCLELGIIDNSYNFNQCIVNNYNEGQGISPHIDFRDYGKVIGCFTLGSGSEMSFTLDDYKYNIYVNPNSLYIMSGDSRYKYKHSMSTKLYDIYENKKIKRSRRVSITFRNVS